MTAIDRAFLDAQTAGDRELAAELLGLFAVQCRRLMTGIAQGTGDAEVRADLAHTLKGSAAGIGAKRIHELAGSVEAALRQGAEPAAALAALNAAVVEALAEIGCAA